MCDRCSHSLFHTPHLNNSPCTDNPCTQDHLHGTAEPGNFRLRPSVCFCSITAPGAQGAPLTRLYSAEEESPFRCTFLLPVSSFQPCFDTREAFSSASAAWLAGEHISRPAVTRVEVLSCSLPSLWELGAGGSTSSFDVQESQCPQLVIELCRSTHVGGIICADSCGIRLETLASADALPSLPSPFTTHPHTPLLPLCIAPLGDPTHPAGAPIERLSGCTLAAACPHLVFSQ